ncbi:cupin domain-containing protein [Pseudooceanicola sp. 502str34]
MAPRVNRETAEHYVWGGLCDGWRLMDQPGLQVIEERIPPGGSEHRHRHGVARQMFYVLDGKLSLEMEGTLHELVTGDALEVPPGAAHRAFNESTEAVRFLVISSPWTREDREPA